MRPISPHLSIYRPQLTSVMSIFHRFTGIFLYLGIIFTSWLIFALVYYPDCLQNIASKISDYRILINLMKLALFGWSFSFFYHLLNGVRHLFWDAGKGFDLKTSYMTGKIVIFLSIILTIGTWWFVYKNYSSPQIILIDEQILIEEGQ